VPFGYDGHVINGYLQNPRYFERSAAKLRQVFSFSTDTVAKAKRIHESVGQESTETGNSTHAHVSRNSITRVGIYVRRGDFIREKRPIANETFFKNAMAIMNERCGVVTLVVSSEDISWCRKYLPLYKGNLSIVFLQRNTPEVDMATTLCQHSIISVGMFGWWAAWFANGMTIYKDDVCSKLNTRYPPNWICLTN
jgi:hypothetical protein